MIIERPNGKTSFQSSFNVHSRFYFILFSFKFLLRLTDFRFIWHSSSEKSYGRSGHRIFFDGPSNHFSCHINDGRCSTWSLYSVRGDAEISGCYSSISSSAVSVKRERVLPSTLHEFGGKVCGPRKERDKRELMFYMKRMKLTYFLGSIGRSFSCRLLRRQNWYFDHSVCWFFEVLVVFVALIRRHWWSGLGN